MAGVRTSAEFVEVLVVGAQGVRTSAEYVEVLVLGAQGVRTSAEYVEVLVRPPTQTIAGIGIVSDETFGEVSVQLSVKIGGGIPSEERFYGNLTSFAAAAFEVPASVISWVATPGTALTLAAGKNGQGLRIDLTGTEVSEPTVFLVQAVRIQEGRTYTAMVHVKPETTSEVAMVVPWLAADGNVISTSTVNQLVTLDTWTKLNLTEAAPAGATHCLVGLRLEANPAPGTVRFYSPNGMWEGRYVGTWGWNLPSFSTFLGDGRIFELDVKLPVPETTGERVGLYVGNWIGDENGNDLPSDGDPAKFTPGGIVMSDNPPVWAADYVGSFDATDSLPGNAAVWDGTWEDFAFDLPLTIDPASDPDWYKLAPPPPNVTAILPGPGGPGQVGHGPAGTTVTLIGTNLSRMTRIRLSANVSDLGSLADIDFTVVDDEHITLVIPDQQSIYVEAFSWHMNGDAGNYGFVSGNFPGGFMAGFVVNGPYDPLPTFTSTTPTTIARGGLVTVTGTDLDHLGGVYLGLFGGGGTYETPTDFTVVSPTQITFKVPVDSIITGEGAQKRLHWKFAPGANNGTTYNSIERITPGVPMFPWQDITVTA